jgi:hypothetical protein
MKISELDEVVELLNSDLFITVANGTTSKITFRQLINLIKIALNYDTSPIENSENPITSGGVYDILQTL